MFTILKRASFAIAIMAMATVSFANDDNYNGNTPNNQSPTLLESITVTINEKGANCPDHGTVKSNWKWSTGYSYHWYEGTTAYYSGVPWIGEVKSIHPGGSYQTTSEASVNAWPDGHPEAHNAAIVYPPYNPITLNMYSCGGNPPPPPPPHDADEYDDHLLEN